jgi:isoleucyl-tRNA synthetase
VGQRRRSHEIDVLGSFSELADRIGRPLPEDFDPHKPNIDQYTWPSPTGTGTMRRVPEVIDTWFDSGSMPFRAVALPVRERRQGVGAVSRRLHRRGVDQTRGWFYSLLAIATGLGDALPNNARRRRRRIAASS